MVLPYTLSAQGIPADSPQEILKHRQEAFRLIQDLDDPCEDTLWYHGRIYEFELRSQIGTPYYLNAGTLPGSITYNGKLHEDLTLSYNLVMDELILWKQGTGGKMIQLVLNKYYVENFTLKQDDNYYHFRLHSEMKPIHDQLKDGFYEVIYDDGVRMFVRHKKELFFDATHADSYSYRYVNQVYLILAGKIYVIHRRRDFLKAFKDYKRLLRDYMRQEKINFKKPGTQSLFALCVYSKSLLDQ